MRLPGCGRFAGLGDATLSAALFPSVAPVQAAFRGGNGLLAVQPRKGRGIVLVKW
jgi:hypothetical protein